MKPLFGRAVIVFPQHHLTGLEGSRVGGVRGGGGDAGGMRFFRSCRSSYGNLISASLWASTVADSKARTVFMQIRQAGSTSDSSKRLVH